jgi:thymidine kinase
MNENGISSDKSEVNRRMHEALVVSKIFASMPVVTIDHLALLFRKINSASEAVN